MTKGAGWVELLDCETLVPLARGRLDLREQPGSGREHEWVGELRSVRAGETLVPGTYRLRFEDAIDEALVELTSVEAGESTLVEVHCIGDCRLPRTLREVGGE